MPTLLHEMKKPASATTADQRLPRLAWPRVLGGGLLVLTATVAAMEYSLAARGFHANLSDSAARWAAQRARVDGLGTKALILVGDSQVLQDLDLTTLRRETGLEPVQLAVAAGSFLPVLTGLANDPDARGTVLVGFDTDIVTQEPGSTPASTYESDYERSSGERWPDFHRSEQFLADALHTQLRSYADGARPLTSLRARILKDDPVRQYIYVLPDREEYSDFSRAPLPDLYYHKVLNNLPAEQHRRLGGESPAQLEAELPRLIETLPPDDSALFQQHMRDVDSLGRRIEAHGGRVLYVDFPVSGYMQDISDRRFPRKLFWDSFAAYTRAPTLESSDVPAIRALHCPDGTHLDVHDRIQFTHALVAALRLGGWTVNSRHAAAVRDDLQKPAWGSRCCSTH